MSEPEIKMVENLDEFKFQIQITWPNLMVNLVVVSIKIEFSETETIACSHTIAYTYIVCRLYNFDYYYYHFIDPSDADHINWLNNVGFGYIASFIHFTSIFTINNLNFLN